MINSRRLNGLPIIFNLFCQDEDKGGYMDLIYMAVWGVVGWQFILLMFDKWF